MVRSNRPCVSVLCLWSLLLISWGARFSVSKCTSLQTDDVSGRTKPGTSGTQADTSPPDEDVPPITSESATAIAVGRPARTVGRQLCCNVFVMISCQLVFLSAAVWLGHAGYHSNAIRNVPIVVTTWDFYRANEVAWEALQNGGTALDAVEKGSTQCEVDQCGRTVGYGGGPDENGETTLDALIMDGNTMNVGAVAALRGVRPAASVARAVLDHTKHSLLAGELATEFALKMGFKREPMSTNQSETMHEQWLRANCQPNFWVNVTPDPTKQCGPYSKNAASVNSTSSDERRNSSSGNEVGDGNHDTIGVVAVDGNGSVAAGTSTNGLRNKIPGRVGDSPIPGAGAYADSSIGGAAATGDGDIIMRFAPSFLAVEEMRRGASPAAAAATAINRVIPHYPNFTGAIIVVSKDGEYGVACHYLSRSAKNNNFAFCVHDVTSGTTERKRFPCIVP